MSKDKSSLVWCASRVSAFFVTVAVLIASKQMSAAVRATAAKMCLTRMMVECVCESLCKPFSNELYFSLCYLGNQTNVRVL